MKTLELEISLIKYLNPRQNIIVNNVSNWSGLLNFEADILQLTNSGYANAYELKVSKQDLKNDLKKKHIKNINNTVGFFNYKSGFDFYYSNLKTFSYVVPSFLVNEALNQIPSFCGLYEAISYEGKIYINIKKQPKILNKVKWDEKQKLKLAHLGCMRIAGLKQKVLNHEK